MRALLVAAILLSTPFLRPLYAEDSPFAHEKAVLLNEIAAWDSWYKPFGSILRALKNIRASAEQAPSSSALEPVNQEFEAWKQARKGDLLLEEYRLALRDPPDIRTTSSFDEFAAARIAAMHRQASEATDVQEALEWSKAHQSFQRVRQMLEMPQHGGSYFDQGQRGASAPAAPVKPGCVVATAPPSPKIPLEFALVRQYFLSKNAEPIVVDNAISATIAQGGNPLQTLSLIWNESRGRQTEDGTTPIMSPKHAWGPMQITEKTAAGEYHIYDVCKLAELRTNLHVGIDYWNNKIWNRFARGVSVFSDPRRLTKAELAKVELAAAAYNIGPTKVAKLGKVPPVKETVDYVNAFLKNMRELAGLMPTVQAKQ